jgi:hypothetical protein
MSETDTTPKPEQPKATDAQSETVVLTDEQLKAAS